MMFGGLILILLLIYLFQNNSFSLTKSHDSALNQLKEKFVNGEITEEEYKRKKSIINE